MKVNWITTQIDDQSGTRGSDEDGNKYFSPANGETVYCTMADGRKGCGWTAAQALESALPNYCDEPHDPPVIATNTQTQPQTCAKCHKRMDADDKMFIHDEDDGEVTVCLKCHVSHLYDYAHRIFLYHPRQP